MSKLLDKLLKNSTIKSTDILEESKFFTDVDMSPFDVPILNVAFSGSLDGGLVSGLTMFAGPSKHFKTLFTISGVRAYFKKNPDAVCLFYDSEFGSPTSYFKGLGIPPDRIVHTPLENIEQFKIDIMQQLDGLERGDKVVIIVDSIGNLASKKEVDDALDGKTVADMSRAKALKSLFRMCTSKLRIKDLPMIVVNHTYSEIGCFDGSTIIKTVSGNKEIRNIEVGDIVYTNNGTQMVNHIFLPEDLDSTNKEFYELEFDDGSKVKCTDNHLFLIDDNEWVSAKDLQLGQFFY